MPKLVKAAHGTLDRLPGRGQAAQAAVRNLSQAALTIVGTLTEMRNELGTGHGRARVPRVSREAAVAASDASILWSRWALARLDEVLGGEVDLLIADLARGGFNRGLLDRRFDEVGLDDLFGDDQYRLGVAVAHRSMGGTFVVWESGVTPLGDRPLDWPEDYRRSAAVDAAKLAEIREALESQSAVIPHRARPAWESLTARFAVPPVSPPAW